MLKKYEGFIVKMALLVLTILILAVLTVPVQQQSALAAPPAAPTPITVVDSDRVSNVLTFQSATVLSATTTTSSKPMYLYRSADVAITVDQTSANPLTVTIQYSLDDTNWDDGINVMASNTTDDTSIVQVPLFGRYVRFTQTVSDTNNITVTIKAQGR